MLGEELLVDAGLVVEPLLVAGRDEIGKIVGSEVYVASGSRFAKEGSEDASGFHLVLLCQNSAGYRNLSYLVSAGYKEGFYYKPRIDKELLAEHSEGSDRPLRLPQG